MQNTYPRTPTRPVRTPTDGDAGKANDVVRNAHTYPPALEGCGPCCTRSRADTNRYRHRSPARGIVPAHTDPPGAHAALVLARVQRKHGREGGARRSPPSAPG